MSSYGEEWGCLSVEEDSEQRPGALLRVPGNAFGPRGKVVSRVVSGHHRLRQNCWQAKGVQYGKLPALDPGRTLHLAEIQACEATPAWRAP